jgi:hypothetical protein
MKSQLFEKEFVYPPNWGEDEKIRFKYYLNDAERMYPKLPKDIIETVVKHQIQVELGVIADIDYDKIEQLEVKTHNYEVIETVEIQA